MAEVKDKIITAESLKAKHDYDESTYLKKSGALNTLGVTATAAELNKLDGVTTTTAELNYVDGVTSNIQTQLDNKLPLSGGTITGNVNFVRGTNDEATMSVTTNENGEVELADKNGSSVLIPLSVEGNTALNFDGYMNANKNTNIYGNSVKIWSNTATLNGREYGVNKVLWDGAYYMQAGQTVTLSESIHNQPNGIVLIFSRYSNGTAQDYDFHHFFIPKYHVLVNDGKGSNFMMCDSTGAVMARKYLYISGSSITGHTNNTATGATSCGITWTNNSFVLRQVIGV